MKMDRIMCRVVVRNPIIKLFNGEVPDWHKEHLHPNGLYYDGYLTELFIATYDGPIKKKKLIIKKI